MIPWPGMTAAALCCAARTHVPIDKSFCARLEGFSHNLREALGRKVTGAGCSVQNSR